MRLYTNIEADSVEEYFDALRKLLAGGNVNRIDPLVTPPVPEPIRVADQWPKEVIEKAQAENAEPLKFNRVSEAIAAAETLELDAHGHPWSADLHASTKGKTQDGLWRMGRGKERPEPMPGYPKGAENPAPVEDVIQPSEKVPVGPETIVITEGPADIDDEFAQFATKTEEPAASTEAPAREWSDADVSNAANWAVNSLGGKPEGIVALRDKYIPAGMVPKTMNIPVEDREAFVQDLEKLVGAAYPG